MKRLIPTSAPYYVCATAILLALLIPGCRSVHGSTRERIGVRPVPGFVAGFPRTLTDARGKRITLKSPPQRIVSLIPSNTEVLYALGVGDKVVAVTTADDYPPEAKKKQKVGDVQTVSIESILGQNLDIVVAIGSLNQKPIAALDRAGAPTLVIDPTNIEDTYASIRLLGRATGRDRQAEQIVREMKARIDRVRAAVRRTNTRPRVLIMYDTNPIYTTGPDSFINDAITIAGGTNIVTTPTGKPVGFSLVQG